MIVLEEMERIWSIGFVLICFGHCFVGAAIKKEYFQVGQSIELKPPAGTATIERILWKHNGNMVAEWATGDTDVEYYGTFRGRANLKQSTGILLIKNTTESEAGEYKLEINDKLLDDGYEFIAIQEVPKPEVWVRPGDTDDERKLNCKGDVSKAGPVTFFWAISEGDPPTWFELGRDVTLRRNETTQRIEKFSCKMVNPAGGKISASHLNPFYVPPINGGLIAGIVIFLLIAIGGGGGFAYFKRDAIKTRFCPGGGGGTGTTGNGTVAPDDPQSTPLKGVSP